MQAGKYRICLVLVLVLVVAGALCFYLTRVDNQETQGEGTLVRTESSCESQNA